MSRPAELHQGPDPRPATPLPRRRGCGRLLGGRALAAARAIRRELRSRQPRATARRRRCSTAPDASRGSTQAGDELAGEARAVCAQVDRLRARAHGIAHGVEPRLAVAVDHMFPLPALVHALREFRDGTRRSRSTLHTEALGAVAELVAGGVCSVGIGADVPKWPAGLERGLLAKVRCCTSRPAPIRSRSAAVRCRGTSSGSMSRSSWPTAASSAKTTRSASTASGGGASSTSPRSTRSFARGSGWGGMPMHVVADDLAEEAPRAHSHRGGRIAELRGGPLRHAPDRGASPVPPRAGSSSASAKRAAASSEVREPPAIAPRAEISGRGGEPPAPYAVP